MRLNPPMSEKVEMDTAEKAKLDMMRERTEAFIRDGDTQT
jgi:hypothetical protein